MPAWLAAPIVKWAAVALVIAGLVVTILLQHANNRAIKSELGAAQQALDLVTQDRDRQMIAVKQLSDINQDQALQLTRLQVDADKAAIVAQQVEQDRQAQLAKLKSDLSSLKEKARANPDQVRPLGPIVRDALRMQ